MGFYCWYTLVPIGHTRYHVEREQLNSIIVNLTSPGQNGRHFAAAIFKRIFLNEIIRFLTKILMKFVPKGPCDRNQALD